MSTVTGTVKTDAQGSAVTFDICERAEWVAMNDYQRREALVAAMWESGMVDVFVNDEVKK